MIYSLRSLAIMGLALSAVVPFTGCGRTAQIGRDSDSLAAIDALYTAVTSHRAPLLEQSLARIEALHSEGKLPPDVHEALEPIMAKAKKGEWDQAARDLHRFIRAQRRE